MAHTLPQVAEYIPVASIDAIDEALYNAMHALLGEQVQAVERYATPRSVMTQEEILGVVGGRTPALILMQDRAPVRENIETLALGSVETVISIEWLVLLVVVDTRSATKALKSSGLKGIYKLQALVYATLNNLFIPGAHWDGCVSSRGHFCGIAEPGKLYVNVMRFITEAVLEGVAPPDLSHPLDELAIQVNAIDTSTGDPVEVLMDEATIVYAREPESE